MRARVDPKKCQAYGACASECPSVFQLDKWGFSSVQGDGIVPAGDEQRARAAEGACPERAIIVED
jgi:ferredoxin